MKEDTYTELLGSYKEASNAADLDNIYLCTAGWAYRHFKTEDKSEYWDELIYTGNGDTTVVFEDSNPKFLTADGTTDFEYGR